MEYNLYKSIFYFFSENFFVKRCLFHTENPLKAAYSKIRSSFLLHGDVRSPFDVTH